MFLLQEERFSYTVLYITYGITFIVAYILVLLPLKTYLNLIFNTADKADSTGYIVYYFCAKLFQVSCKFSKTVIILAEIIYASYLLLSEVKTLQASEKQRLAFLKKGIYKNECFLIQSEMF